MKKLLLAVIVLFGVGLAVWEKPQETAAIVAEVQKPEVGFAAPHFTLTGLDQQTYKVEGKRAKPLVLNFWASWCGPCKLEAPDLQKVYEKYGGQVDLYGVNVTSNDSPEAAMAFVTNYKLTFPIPMDVAGTVSNRYKVMAFPTTYLIDADGIVRKKIIGMVDAPTLELELRQLLSPKP
ncbi:TlpA family protein disulfide reductase [Brevibacillus brevis]|uniref:TlpA family protein disulfide reductase n=1 Tax=Brevibacillus brevis TaxID=1393 RepID=UPI001F415EA3|nr:TlpA disulfide reductase family protein [Brevibacillus brevis]UIO40213.1 TlpA family protein disulfide reductase [Brevibacillus brevis]